MISDIYSKLDRFIIFPLSEKVYGSNILKNYRYLKSIDWYSKEQLESIQLSKLKRLILHIYSHVPYYQDLFHSIKLTPDDIKSIKDLHKIPILTKQIIRDNYDKLTSTDIKNRKIKSNSTGGSTGTPLIFNTDIQTWNMSWASTFRAWSWYGFFLGEKIFTIGGQSLMSEKQGFSKKDFFEKYLMRNYKYSCSQMKQENLEQFYKAFIKLRPSAIRGYASSLYIFAKYIEDNHLNIVPIKVILTTGEILLPQYRRKVQEIFKAPIFDNYGAGDGGISAHECYMHEGMHITEERCIIEICSENGTNVEDGMMGNVITTDLDNYSFPFIRYKVGDIACIKKDLCSCGRKSALIGEVIGRSGKLLYSKNGIPISPTVLDNLLYKQLDFISLKNQIVYNKIDRFQIKQDFKGDILIYLILKNKNDDYRQFDYIIENFNHYFSNSEVKLEFVTEIPPLPSGKEDFVISDFKYCK